MSENLMAEVVLDVKRHVKRLVRADPNIVDLRGELVNNVFPLIEAAMVAVDARMQMAEAAIGELAESIEGDDVGIEPELAEEVKSVFALGGQIAALLTQQQAPDDITRKRWVDLITSYNEAVASVVEKLDEITLAPEDDEEDADDEDEDDDGDDDDGEPITAPGATAPKKGGA